jgi:hypothetical protein
VLMDESLGRPSLYAASQAFTVVIRFIGDVK